MLARHIAESESSGSAWPTPTTKDSDVAGPRELEVLRTGEDAGTTFQSRLKLAVLGHWPTPMTADAGRASGTFARGNQTLTGSARSWPTPTAMDSKSAGRAAYDYGNPGTTLTDAMRMWPTPDATVSNDGEEPGTWRARQALLVGKGVNGNGAGVPLAISAKEWATPVASPSTNRTIKPTPSAASSGGKHGEHLSAQAASGAWCTPTVADSDSGPGSSEAREGGLNLRTQIITSSPQDPTTETGGESTSPATPVLNPRFVEALMGFPLGWTAFELSETPSSRRRRIERSRFLLSAALASRRA